MEDRNDCFNLKSGVKEAMEFMDSDGWKLEESVGFLMDEVGRYCNEEELVMLMITLARYEIEHDCLEDRVLVEISHYIPHYESGDYHKKLHLYERMQLNEDIAYIKKQVILYDPETIYSLEDD